MSKEKGKRGGGGGDSALSAEDSALWRFVTRDVAPTRGKSRVRIADAKPTPATTEHRRDSFELKVEEAQRSTQGGKSRPAESKRVVTPPAGSAVQAKQNPSSAATPVQIERRKTRRIARGAEDIEARLDLHGMTQDEAHGALTRFIHRCHAQGMKTVLVITGKGRAGDSGDGVIEASSRGRGVLRRNVPRWLHEAGLAALVVGYSAASVRHGGDGALYVMLRKRR
jgi:DNA-nicking Smr family endonuclease